MLLALQILVYSFSLWFGLYLLARDFTKPALRFAGFGLIAYALGIGLDALPNIMPDVETLAGLRWIALYLPGLFWFGATIHLLPGDFSLRAALTRLYRAAWLPAVVLLIALSFAADVKSAVLQVTLTIIIGVLLLVGLISTIRAYRASNLPQPPRGLVVAATLFFGLGMGLLLLPLSRDWVVLAIGVDLLLLGVAAAVLDAFDEGESLRRDFARSLGYSSFTVLIFGGQVAVAIAINGLSPTLLALLLVIVASAAALQTFADPLQTLFDRLTLSPRLSQERADLRAAVSATTRLNDTLDLRVIDEVEFTRLTRRALSHFGDLNRLAANPLTRLPIIDARLAERGAPDNTLERAVELKALLAESIHRLKPRGRGDFGTSDEWRFYNALYFPYVAGLKPYSRAFDASENGLDPNAKAALDWLQTSVPERTLHNWQNAAAKLVALDLREKSAPHWQ